MAATTTEPPKPRTAPVAEKPNSSAKAQQEQALNQVWAQLALRIQPKLVVSSPDDPYEREADEVADQVMRMPDRPSAGKRLPLSTCPGNKAQRNCAACKEEEKLLRKCAGCQEEDERLQRKESSNSADAPATAPPLVHEALKAPGQPLDLATRNFFEPRFGQDFSRVRMHADARAAESARALNARAYTVGHHIVFGGQGCGLETQRGKRLLAHELVHVVQQGRKLPSDAPSAARAPLVQLQEANVSALPNTEGDDPALAAAFEQELLAAEAGMNQDVNLILRAEASRRALLLLWRPHPPLTKRDDLDALISEVDRMAATEPDTLAVFSAMERTAALAVYPKGFPLIWSERVKEALTLGVDSTTIAVERAKLFEDLRIKAIALGPQIFAHGLPVPLKDVRRVDGFRLRITDAHVDKPTAVRDYARDSIRYAQLKWIMSFAFTWEKIVDQLAADVADGKVVVDYQDWKDFLDNKQTRLRELPMRARDQLAKTEEEAEQFQTDVVNLGKAALLVRRASALFSLSSPFSAWKEAQALFDISLKIGDLLVATSGEDARLVIALKWAWDNDYFSGAAKESVQKLIAEGPDILKEIAVILLLGTIPGVNIGVAVYLAFTVARSVLEMITELGLSMYAAMKAQSVAELQKAAARLAQILVQGAITILIVLITMGVARAASRIRTRIAELKAADVTLTEEQAAKRALHEMSAEERAALETGPAKIAKKFLEFEGACSIGSINCRFIPKHLFGKSYPKEFGVPMPKGPFRVQKAVLSDVARGTETLRKIARDNRHLWPEFDRALAAAEKKGRDWPVDSNGVPWEVHHVKPVFMGGDNAVENLFPLPKRIHQKYTDWWNDIHKAFKDRFTNQEWDQIYWSKKDVLGSRVPKTRQR